MADTATRRQILLENIEGKTFTFTLRLTDEEAETFRYWINHRSNRGVRELPLAQPSSSAKRGRATK